MNVTANDNPARGSHARYLYWARAVTGASILAIVAYWVFREGSLLRPFSVKGLSLSILVLLFANIANAVMLRTVARMYGREMTLQLALYAGAIGSLGNATGGLAIGTTLKYVILRKRVGLTTGEITFGLVGLTVVILLSMLVFASVSIQFLDFPIAIKIVPTVLLAGVVATAILSLHWMRKRQSFSRLVKPLMDSAHRRRFVAASLAYAALLLLTYTVLGLTILPHHPLALLVFISSSSLLFGIASFIQSIAGLHELLMGLTAFMSGIPAIEGTQLALAVRLGFVITSGLMLGWLHFMPKQTHRKKTT